MGFCLQLKLLLWKNFTLKKRKPLVLMFELVIPLVLFFILLGIRKKQPAYPVGSSRFVAYPLPSAGVIAVMQAFCDNGIRDENGFANFPNSSVTGFLEKLNSLSQRNFVEPGFTPSELDEIPHIYRSLVEDPVTIHDSFVSTTNTPIKDLFVDEQGLEMALSENLSLPILGVKSLMDSTLDMSKIYYLIFGSEPRLLVRKGAMGIPSSLLGGQSQAKPQSFTSSLKQLLSRLQFVYKYSSDVRSLWDALSWILNTNKIGSLPQISPLELAKDVERLLLSDESFSKMLCPKFRLVSFLKNVSNAKEVENLQNAICNSSTAVKHDISVQFGKHFNTTRLMNVLHIEEWDFQSAKEKVQKFSDDLEKFYIFEKTLKELSELASSLPQDSCNLSNSTQADNDTIADDGFTHKKAKKRNPRYGLLRIWLGMQKTICGKETKLPLPSFPQDGSDINLEELGMSTSQQEQIGLLVHVLYSNPKVLYAPNETEADSLITKANETFRLLDTVTQYARKMLNVSEEIQLFLAQNDTEHSLSVLRHIQSILHSHPELMNLSEGLQKFAEGSIISNKETFLEQLKLIDNAACSWNSLTSGISLNVFQGFRSEEDLLVYFKQRAYFDNVTVLASVVFNMEKNGSLPNHMIYKIRQNASFTSTTNLVRNRFWFPGPRDWGYSYYQFGFVWIQDILERAMVSLYAGRDVVEPGTYVHQFPYPCYMEDQFLFMIEHVMPLCLTISWVYSVSMLVQSIVHEKEQRLKEVMKTMGLNNAVHWLAWFITSFVQMTITAAILTVILKYGLVLTYSDPIVIFLMLEIFVVANIAFSFLVSVLYSKAKLAAACAGIIYFLTYVPYMYIAVREEAAHDNIPAWLKSIASILSTTAFGLGAKYFAFYEEVGVGVQLSNMAISPLEGDDFSLWQVAVMMLLDTLLYSVLVWYIENVHPGAYGLPKPWYFPFTKSYWFGVSRRDCGSLRALWQRLTRKHPLSVREDEQACAMANRSEDSHFFEPDPIHLPLGVSIDNLEKVYKNGNKLAVNKLSLNLYENQITSFLGHNGAGKTTTMSILTGLFPPTSGYAIIYGRDIRTEMDLIRQSMGMCPQHNVLFDELTVEEHLWFYARLKGTPECEIPDEMEKMLEDLNFQHKRHSKVYCLSGGMKRKLSVAIAFVAGSRIVILDEPTAGVDPYSRRAIWDLILKYKRGRTILLSTHHMDEADVLGDRIAIVAHGKLRCCGSSLFLKNNLGEGYHLVMVKKPFSQIDRDKFDTEKVTSFITRHVSSSYLVSESKHELHFILPLGELRKGCFEKLFEELESSLPLLGISSYGIKHTTLEEVFLQVAETSHISQESPSNSPSKNGLLSPKIIEDQEPEKQSLLEESDVHLEDIANCNWHEDDHYRTSRDNSFSDVWEGAGSYKVEGNFLLLQQFIAILTKRCYCTRRNWKGLFSQILLPAFFVSIAMSVALTAPKIEDMPPIVLSPSQYFNYTLPDGNVISVGNQHGDCSSWSEDATTEKLIETFHQPAGVGATCVLKSPYKPFNNNVTMKMQEIRDKLLADYFEPMCQSVFNPGIPLVNFVPVAPTITPKDTNSSWYYTTELPSTEDRLYPLCHCSSDNTGYVCQSYGYKDPPSFRVVTRDLLINIGQQNEHEYYLYTTDMYRLRRYGAFSFGFERDYVHENFGQNSPVLFRKIAVRNAAKVWYNNKGFHSMPIYVNSINNAILRANLPPGKGHPSGYGITLINHPMTDTSYMLSRDQILQGTDVLIAIFIIVAMSFVPASFVLFLVYERYTKAKHLQFVSGVNPIIYWVANYFWDMCSYVVPATCCVLILLIFDIPAYASHKNFPAVVSLFLMYGWSITPVMYPVSFVFKEPSTAYIFLIVINLFVGITCVVTSFLLEVFSENVYLVEVHKVLKCVFLVFPNYCLGRGLMDIAFNEYQNFFLFKTGQYTKMISPFAWTLVSRKLVAMAVSGLVAFLITLLLEFRFFLKQKKRQLTLPDGDVRNEDEDVAAERWRVVSGRADGDILRLVDLTKVYRTNKLGQLLAVNRLCLGVPEGECLGLLGVNGAGKSTTFKMLTGDTTITAGDAFLGGYSVRRELQKVQQFIGYCPQFDALYDELTAREHLCLYSRFRGIPRKEEKEVIEWALKKLDLALYADRPAGTYSGGNKRKLSTAIALLGAPRVIYLDEPSTGMDPFTRRFMWNLIHDLVKSGRSVVLTSHSMEECEALCTRMGIMVNGQFKCLGSVQHLKNRFGEGYYITVRTKEHEMETVQRWFRRIFHDAALKESHYNILQYELKSGSISLAYVFSKMESALQELPIEEYSVCQNTLDNVFVNFVKQQSDNVERINGSFEMREETIEDSSDDDLHCQISRSQSRLAFLHLDVET